METKLSILLGLLLSCSTSYANQASSYQCDTPPFNAIVLMQYENHLINQVNEQIRMDDLIIHNSEQVVAFNQSILQNGGDRSLITQVDPEYLNAVERRDLRSDNCLDSAIYTTLNAKLTENCRPDNVQDLCGRAKTRADRVSENARDRTQTAMRSRANIGPVEFLQNYLEPLIPEREQVNTANKSCAEAIAQATGPECQETFSQFFSDEQLMDLFSKTCTPDGVRNQLLSLGEQLNRRGSVPDILQHWSTIHIQNREKENTIAEEVIKLAELYNRITSEVRLPASDEEEN